MKVKNESSRTLTIAATGQSVDPGDIVEVPKELGRSLCEQPDVWAEAKTSSKTTKPKGDD